MPLKPDLKRLLGDDFLQRGGLTAQSLNLVSGGRTGLSLCHAPSMATACTVARQAAFACFKKLLRPHVIQALSNALTVAKLGDGDDAVMPGA